MLSLSAQILRVLGESAIAVRTKAMKCLSEVVAVDPSILARVSVLLLVGCCCCCWSTTQRVLVHLLGGEARVCVCARARLHVCARVCELVHVDVFKGLSSGRKFSI